MDDHWFLFSKIKFLKLPPTANRQPPTANRQPKIKQK